jgi:hypothetical protein
MRVSKKSSRPNFNPVTLEITLESAEELAEFYCLFNFLIITECCPHLDDNAIRDQLGDVKYLPSPGTLLSYESYKNAHNVFLTTIERKKK